MQSDDTTVSIPLLARDGSLVGHTLVDAADAEWVQQWTWRLQVDQNGTRYACRRERTGGYGARAVYIGLHRELMGLPRHAGDLQVDHISGDGLLNTRSNLRVVTCAQNQQNRKVQARSKSGYRGVSWKTSKGKWVAQGKVNYQKTHIGLFDTLEAANEAAIAWRRIHMPYATD